MAVITISRNLGSDGAIISEKVAELLGYHLVEKKVLENILRRYGLVHFDQVYEEEPSLWNSLNWQLALTTEMFDRTIKGLAHHGNMVILGRGCYAALGGLADVLNVRIQAPRDLRTKRVMDLYSLGRKGALDLINKEDRKRAGFIEKAYEVCGADAAAFDLVIDTRVISPDRAADLIVTAVNDIVTRSPVKVPTATKREVGPTLVRVIREILECETSHDQTT